ncbi:MAG: hypothetical protein IPN80_09320 [Flavobacterium sp.]|nr:hypothetical protein [Flavobacterium sp.]
MKFCNTATVLQGSATNAISLKGNTNGNNTYYFRVYIDWDQNGIFGTNALKLQYRNFEILQANGAAVPLLGISQYLRTALGQIKKCFWF